MKDDFSIPAIKTGVFFGLAMVVPRLIDAFDISWLVILVASVAVPVSDALF